MSSSIFGSFQAEVFFDLYDLTENMISYKMQTLHNLSGDKKIENFPTLLHTAEHIVEKNKFYQFSHCLIDNQEFV